jgi:hypothetical protein
MKRTTRNNILRYLVATVFVSAFVLIVSLLLAGLDWIVNKTGWPIYPVVLVAGFIYVVYFVGKGITIKDKKEE